MTRKKKNDELEYKETIQIIGVLVVLIGMFFAFYWIFGGIGKIKYEGLVFIKEKFGEIPIYHYSYNLPSKDGGIVQYNLYLRNNPRENKAFISEGEIEFPAGKRIYISVDSGGLTGCEYSGVAISSLAAFLTNNNLDVKGGTPYEEEAKLRGLFYANCERYPDNPVILIKGGNESMVNMKGNCYTLIIANCEATQVVEKFIVQAILDAKARD